MIAPVIVNQVTGHLVDGHARVEEYLTAGLDEVPVVYVELSEDEEKLALLALDPVGAMAVNDHRALNALLEAVDIENRGLNDLLDDLRRQAANFQPDLDPELRGTHVSDEDIDAARIAMERSNALPEQSRVLCPHCGNSFFV